MNLRPRRRQSPDINLTPLIDVVFLLLIFFMVSTTFRKETELRIELPEAAPPPTEAAAKTERLDVGIDAAGGYSVNGKALADNRRETLRAALVEAVGERRDLPLAISADAKTTHQAVVTVMDVAGRLGFKRLEIPTVPLTEQESE